jgi:hypothetical protein
MRSKLAVGVGLAAVFFAGLVAAYGGGTGHAASRAGTTTHAAVTVPTVQQTTTEQLTVTTTSTQTVQSGPSTVIVTPPAASSDTSASTDTWALIAIAAMIVAFIGLIGWLATRHKGHTEDLRRLAEAVAAWVAQGWAPESQTETTAVLRRGSERTLITVDAHGNISSQAVGR